MTNEIDNSALINKWLIKILSLLSLVILSQWANAQCNTTLNKLLPERSVNNQDRFGSGMALSDRYMVVSAENSDTLGVYYGGAAYVFEKTAAGWAYRAMLVPSDPVANDFFGNKLAIDEDGSTIVILNRNYNKGGVYIYERPSSGWTNMTETAKVSLPVYLEFNASVDIKDDGSFIALITTANNQEYFFLSRPSGGWTSSVIPQSFDGPRSSEEWAMGILLQDDYLYISTGFGANKSGINVYKNDGSSYKYLAKLSTSIPPGLMGYFGKYLTASGDIFCATGAVSESGNEGLKLFVFKKNGEWTDTDETSQIMIPESEDSYRFPFPIQLLSQSELAASVLVKDGEYYKGKLLIATAQDPNWQSLTSDIIFEEPGLNTRSEFAGTLAWNGTDLVGTVSSKSSDRFAAVSLTRSAGVWGSQQMVGIKRNSSSFVNFGSAVVKTRDALFSGAPYDGGSGRDAGAVFIYEKNGDEFVKTHSIRPSRRIIRPTGGSDAGFGFSLAVHEDDLAVGAPSFRYAEARYGKIYLYKRITPSWTSAILYDSIVAPNELMLNHVGAALAMNDRYLFASAYNNLNNEHSNAVLVYEKIDNKWTFQQLLKLGNPLDKEWPAIRFSLYEDNLLVSSYYSLGGGVSLFTKNPATNEWEVGMTLTGELYSGFGGDIKLEENHLFVGVPGYNFNGVLKSGAVFVYTKLPGEEWDHDKAPSAILSAATPVEGGYFGSSLDAIGNTLAVGAPGKFLTEDYNVRVVPGNTYIIQSKDYYWQNTTQFLNLQGDRYLENERDHFGSDIGIDDENFYIGARSENTATGMFSGAVYYIPSPPIIFLHPPVCEVSGVIQLSGYPFGGTWSGAGIIDPSGKFHPEIAGVGISTLTYTTPNCHNVGTIEIDVKAPYEIAQLSPADVTICDQTDIVLQLELVAGNYDWYFKPKGNSVFTFIGTGGAERIVTNPGEYYAITQGLSCPAESPVFNIHTEEDLQISVGPQPLVCSKDTIFSLVSSHPTGIWEGPGVQGNEFNSNDAANGFYHLTYRFTTPAGCVITLKDSVKVKVVQPFRIHRIPLDFCATGSALLQADPANESLSYTWNFSPTSESDLTEIQKPLTALARVFEQGYYQAVATNVDGCSANSDIINVGFNTDLPYKLTPGENSQNIVCSLFEFEASIQSRTGTTYSWAYKKSETEPYEILSGPMDSVATLDKSGFYRVQGEYGFCSFTSLPFHVEFLADSLFVPNVFTPGSDRFNPVFEIRTTRKVSQLKVFNRFGTQIHASTSGPWDGGDYPSGTYFWLIRYEGCDNRQEEAKGWVSLLR